MGPEPIIVTLSAFEKLEIVRAELRARSEELAAVERELRSAARALESYRFIKTISPYYAQRPEPEEASRVPELEARRQALYQLLQTLKATVPRLEGTASGPGMRTLPRQGEGRQQERRRGRHGSFDASRDRPAR